MNNDHAFENQAYGRQDLVVTFSVLSAIGIIVGVTKYSVDSAFFGAMLDSKFIKVFAGVDGIIGFLTPFIIAAFFSINSYLCLIFINGKGTILPLVDKLWIGFLPMLISTFISSWVLLDLNYTAIDDIIHSDDKGAIEISGMLTMDSLKYLNYIAMGLLYCYVAFCFRVSYRLSLLKSVACTIMPTAIMYLFMLLI